MEVSLVRKRLKAAIDAARGRAQERRQRNAAADTAYSDFLENVATPLFRQVASALKAEGHAFTVFTPGGSVRLASDRSRDDFMDLTLDTSGEVPQVLARISFSRGSRTIDQERPVRAGAGPEAITEEELLEFIVDALEPWIER
jgi:hypothetical protein